MNFELQALPKYILLAAVVFAPQGVAMEDVQAKLVSVIRSEAGKNKPKTSKAGFLKVSKTLELSVTSSFTARLEDSADTMPIRFYRFCEHARKTQADFGADAETALPKDLKDWLTKLIGAMTPAKSAEKKSPEAVGAQ